MRSLRHGARSRYLRRVGNSSADHLAVKAAARALGIETHGDASAASRVGSAIHELLTLGGAAGEIRPGVTVEDLFLLMTTVPVDQSTAVRERWIELVLPGIVVR